MATIKKVSPYPIFPTNVTDDGKNLISALKNSLTQQAQAINQLIDELERVKKLEGIS